MNIRTKRLASAAGVAVLLLFLPSAVGQTVTATLVGTITDQTGGAIPGAKVQATNVATGISSKVQSNERGDYLAPQLQAGVYQVTAECAGFKRAVINNLELRVDQTARQDFTLVVGQVAESVEVTAAAAIVESETSSIGQAIDTRQMADLPLKGRGFYELAQLAPATSPQQPNSFVGSKRPTPGGLNAPAFNVGGAREKSNGYLIDGVDAQDPHYLTPSFFASVDAIQEFKLQSNSYSAEFGRSATQLNAATRSGTNAWHGSAYEYFRNDHLDATSFFGNFTGQGKLPLRYNQFGGTFGGPVSLPRFYSGRNRTFFFVNYEGTQVRRGSTGQLSVSTPEQRNGDFSRLNFRGNRPIYDPATTRANPAGAGVIRDAFPGNIVPAARTTDFAKAVLALYPQPNSPATTGNNYFAGLSNLSDNNQGIARIDHRINDSNSIFFRYAIFDGMETAKSPIDYSGSSTDVHTQNMAFNYVRTFNPRTLNELRLGYNRPIYLILQDGAFEKDYATMLGIKNLLRDPIGWGVPTTSLSGGFSGMGSNVNPTTQVSNVYHLVDHVSLMRGKHALKLGGDMRKINYNDRSERDVRGTFGFTGGMTANPQQSGSTGISVADLLLGLPLTAIGSNTSLAGNFNGFTYAFFVQDDWKINRRITLNLGLRYELGTRYTDVQNRLTLFDPNYPGGRLLIAGTSTAYVPGKGVVDGPATPRGLLAPDKSNWAPRVGLAFRPFGDNKTAVRAGYGVFYDVMELQDLRTWVRNPPFGATISISGDQNANSSSPSALRVAELFPPAGSPAARPTVYSPNSGYRAPYYQQWNLSVQRAVRGSAVVELGYIGSKGTRLAQRLATINQAIFDPDPLRPTPILTRRPFPLFGDIIRITNLDANSTYHAGFIKAERRFASGFSLLTTYTYGKSLDAASLIDDNPRDIRNRHLDKGRSDFDVRHRLVASGSWELPFGKGRRFLSAGALATALGGWQVNGIVRTRSGFPFGVGASGDVCNCGASNQSAQQVGNPLSGFQQSRMKWFNTAAFIQPSTGRLGSSGRNILDGPGSITFDLSLFKSLSFKEKAQLQFRAEAFNLFNRVNFSQPGATVNSTSYGIIQGTSDPRILQMALKLKF